MTLTFSVFLGFADSIISLASNSDFVALEMDGADMEIDLSSLQALKDVIEDEERKSLAPSWSGMLKSMVVHLLHTF